jgi:hypothetical protein
MDMSADPWFSWLRAESAVRKSADVVLKDTSWVSNKSMEMETIRV